MPDLTTEYATACSTQREWETTVPSSSGTGTYTVRWGRLYGRDLQRQQCQYGYTCTCKGFDIRGTCSHVRPFEQADLREREERPEGHRCGWDDRWEIGSATDDGHCPCCGSETFSYAYGA